jgi:hypothetical protein
MAGQGKKTFVAGEVLLAQDVNDYLMDQSVMNFATVAARSSAIPTPTTGMVSYVGDTGSETATGATIANVPQIQAYTGADWQNVDGLTLVAKATIGTGISSVTMSNVFNANHDSYKIVISGGVGSSANYGQIRLNNSSASYGFGAVAAPFSGATLQGLAANNLGAFLYTWYLDPAFLSCDIDLVNPFLTTKTILKTNFTSDAFGFAGAGLHNVAVSHTGFILQSVGGQTLTGGTIYVYGYRKS